MKYTRYSLVYPAIVLLSAGAGLLFSPSQMLILLMATGTYETAFIQLAGMFMVVLSVFVIQAIRYQFRPMYVWAVFLRLFVGACLIWFYRQTSDPFFLIIFGILCVGISLTLAGLWCDRHFRLQQVH
ncbi:MAG: hypothetical protein F6K16_39490 [Symploca sp. SIO2B6]|nr:hypothetical protein [Symploca sp. SIO2B6]